MLVYGAEDREPALGYTLRIDGKEIRLEPGKEIQVDGEFKDPKVSLVPDKFRKFSAAGVSFNYPSHFGFAMDAEEEGVTIWTLDGTNVVIMLQAYDAVMNPKEFGEILKSNYGPATEVEAISHTFGGKKYSGVRVRAILAGASLTQDLIALPSPEGSRILLLQGLDEKDEASKKDAKTVLKFLDETLKLEN
ncbi:hypothetical protein OJ996_05890 [Luteolibacter sp. GHJ8]|uniref:Uncharacterized protein n=2 Tax=Luteolibacter rhizosphaerae TaxID=2989719 RepID=A0ABT3FZS6_9BACT|nr:hypothetical protein [Luteolibacter rhizosphaerae]